MKNIWHIFTGDVRRIKKNVIALIAIVGIAVVPCLYAWFNIAASWDPYKNTGNLKVAVASVDEGYEGNLIPIQLNVGDQVLSILRENTDMEWVFTSKEKAVNGVRSGDYYAAIVIPEQFSNEMMSIFSEDIKKAEIIYYSNAKENAIAPKVTEKGATSIQRQINQVFIRTVSDTILVVLQSVSNMTDTEGAESVVENLEANLDRISLDLSSSADALQSFSAATSSSGDLLEATSGVLEQAQTQSESNMKVLKDIRETFSDVHEALSGITDDVNGTLSSGKDFYDQMSSVVDTAFETQSKDVESAAFSLNTIAEQLDSLIVSYTSLRDSLESMGKKYPQFASLTEPIVAKLNAYIATQNELKDKLISVADSMRTTSADIGEAKKELDNLIMKSIEEIEKIKTDYEENVTDTLKNLSKSLEKTDDGVKELLSQIGKTTDGIKALSDSATDQLSRLQSALDSSIAILSSSSSRISEVTGKLQQMEEDGDFSEIDNLLSDNKDKLTSFVSSPVSLKTHKIYEMENYGSSMAPFYSTLSIWIGGIVLVAMMKVTVSETQLAGLRNVKPSHIYFGRYVIFLIIGLLQSTLIALGDLFYLGIQCRHPFLFLLASWFSSIVYVNIIYTLTVSFGDIGKAISVILLVIQVAGTGGTFPIEVAPLFFRVVYPLLPFTHSMSAMREAVGGLYGMYYWADMGKLGIFLALSLIVGLVLRKPIIKLNSAFSEKLEETKIM